MPTKDPHIICTDLSLACVEPLVWFRPLFTKHLQDSRGTGENESRLCMKRVKCWCYSAQCSYGTCYPAHNIIICCTSVFVCTSLVVFVIWFSSWCLSVCLPACLSVCLSLLAFNPSPPFWSVELRTMLMPHHKACRLCQQPLLMRSIIIH